jgi:tetratricopeptide (TPR) repeat protein
MQTSTWRNTETMSLRAMSVTRDNYLIESNYCSYLEKLNRLDEAAAQCRASIEHEPNVVYPYNGLGSVQLRQGRYDEARETLQRALQVDPNYSMVYGNLSKVETGDNDFTKALQYLERAIGTDKDGFFDQKRRTEAYSDIGNAALKQKKYEAAAEAFKRGLEASPENLDMARSLSMAYRSMGKVDDAIALLTEIIRKNPASAEAYNTLGTIYAEQNRRAEAAAQFQKALQINPNFTPARNNLQRVSQQ